MSKKQLTSTLLMVPPVGFAFNQQTATDNVFQHTSTDTAVYVRDKALAEYQQMVNQLRKADIQVIEFSAPAIHIDCPDAVFPNNWLRLTHDGQLQLFPMLTPNRQREVLPTHLHALLEQKGYIVNEIKDYRGHHQLGVLEGTGAMVFDHANKKLYAALSERCELALLKIYAEENGYQLNAFHTSDPDGHPIYHTNVMLSIGANTAIVCSDVIADLTEKEGLLTALAQHHQIVEISYQQMVQGMCGNLLQVTNKLGDTYWVMSESAFNAFTEAQRAQLRSSSQLLVNPIPTIEQIGGGSCRCMMAEVFLPRR